MLLEAGADKTIADNSGWVAYEHAVFRGHLEIGRLTKPDKKDTVTFEKSAITNLVDADRKAGNQVTKARFTAGRLYGHKYLTDQSMIIITLGSNDIRNPLSRCFMKLNEPLYEDKRLSIAVSAIGATGETPILDLPPNNQLQLLDPEPMVLFTSKPEDVILRFDLVETFGPSRDNNILARATATLASDQLFTKSKGFKGHAQGNVSLRGHQTAPIVQASTMECIGSLGFEYFVVTPFSHPKMTVGDRYTYYKSLETKVTIFEYVLYTWICIDGGVSRLLDIEVQA